MALLHLVAVAVFGLHPTLHPPGGLALQHLLLLAPHFPVVVGFVLHCEHTFPVVVHLSVLSYWYQYTY